MEKLAKDWLPNIFNDPDFRYCLEECDKLLGTKGNDYTRGKASLGRKERLSNFYESSEFFGISPLQSVALYWFKHVMAIFRFVKSGHVDSEPIESRVQDAINYLLFLFKLISIEKENKVSEHQIMGDEPTSPGRKFLDNSLNKEIPKPYDF